MLADNRVKMREFNSSTYNKLVQIEKGNKPSGLLIEKSRQGNDTLAVLKDGKPFYIHSKYNPQKEVISFLENIEDLSETEHLFIVGLGLGYHLEQILLDYPKIRITIFEPNLEILYKYLCKNQIHKNIIHIFNEIEDIQDIEKLAKDFSVKTTTIIWPSYVRIYKESVNDITKNLIRILKSTKRNLTTDIAFQRRWIANALLNYPTVLQTSNIATEKYQSVFEGKPVIIVSAGPSLNEDIEEIRKIKEAGSAYIFAVGSGVNVLLHHKIIPHAVFLYDPTVLNQKVLQRVKDEQITQLPLVFGSSVGYETLIDYPSKMVHMITSADTLSKNLLNISPSQIILDSPSVAVMTLQVVNKLNMSPIILAGQNLGYLNNTVYGEGGLTARTNNELTDEELKNRILTKDVYGNNMYTSEGYMNMRSSLENIIKLYNHSEVINTTKKGAYIEGAKFIELTTVRKMILCQKNITLDDWVMDDIEYLDGVINFNLIFEDYLQMMTNIDESVKIANKIKLDYESNIYSKTNELVQVFFKSFIKVIESDSHQFIIKQAIKVQNKKFMDNYKLVEYEKQPRKKAERFVEIVYSYLGNVYETTEALFPIIQKVKFDVNQLAQDSTITSKENGI